ncbi:hypothetical protein ACHAW5_007236 [Stephanodiscus triporus]|uniref:glycerol-3-phosphate dehydrogenase n=1 Tax=Stephanodiscus triporus TaxID=2934178 RepID=A0ABD3NU80_9STRA
MNDGSVGDPFHSLPRGARETARSSEGQHNDARTDIAIALSAAGRGADIANYVEMTGRSSGDRTISDVRAIDRVTGDRFEIRARNVIFRRAVHGRASTEGGTGPRARSTRRCPGRLARTSCCLGITPTDMGLLDYNTSDGRFLFFRGSASLDTLDRDSSSSFPLHLGMR